MELKAIYELQLTPDRVFIVKLLPRVLLNLFGASIRDRASREECKTQVLKAHYPLFVKEKLIREMVVFCFQKKECHLRKFNDIINAVEFLRYSATEGEIVDRILMNFHPDVLAYAAFLSRPASYQQLREMVGHG